MMFGYDHDMSGWGYAAMVLGMMLFWALIVAGIVALIRFSTGAAQNRTAPQIPPRVESPEQLLANRFARGEIDQAEYRSRLEVLRTTPRP